MFSSVERSKGVVEIDVPDGGRGLCSFRRLVTRTNRRSANYTSALHRRQEIFPEERCLDTAINHLHLPIVSSATHRNRLGSPFR